MIVLDSFYVMLSRANTEAGNYQLYGGSIF